MTFLLTFEGIRRPEEIFLFDYPLKVEQYVPLITQCRSCLRFGHSKNRCRSKARCAKCGGGDHTYETCYNLEQCIYCLGHHLAIDKNLQRF